MVATTPVTAAVNAAATASTTKSGGGKKTAQRRRAREFAALEFLSNIPLRNEREIVRAGLAGRTYRRRRDDEDDEDDEDGVATSGARRSSEEGTTAPPPPPPSSPSARTTTVWWEKLVSSSHHHHHNRAATTANVVHKNHDHHHDRDAADSETELETPDRVVCDGRRRASFADEHDDDGAVPSAHAHPGRRLEGPDASYVDATSVVSRRVVADGPSSFHKTVARNAAAQRRERRLALGLRGGDDDDRAATGLLDGRVFFSSRRSYPVGVFSVIKYEPEREAAARRRRKLEEAGGGGSTFVIPPRDWRGISYRALLPNNAPPRRNKSFQRVLDDTLKTLKRRDFSVVDEESSSPSSSRPSSSLTIRKAVVEKNEDDDDDDDSTAASSSSSSSESTYDADFLDDPTMVQGRHRHVMFGDLNTGPIVSSTIQFVKPAELKADLNKRFRERFDGWEPAKRHRRRLVGARVVGGAYVLQNDESNDATAANDDGAVVVVVDQPTTPDGAGAGVPVVRMPPSLTLSKIRSIKRRALLFCVNEARLEVSTVALACVYFERLCLDCRVDKSNRRLTFAACLLVAAKTNEANVALVHNTAAATGKGRSGASVLKVLARSTTRSSKMYGSLFEFFAQDWNLNLRTVFAAEWGVFVALGFRLHVSLTKLAFHFKRLMKVLERSPRAYLGVEMYNQWQDCLEEDAVRRDLRDARKESRRERRERRLVKDLRTRGQQQQQQQQLLTRDDERTDDDGGESSDHRDAVGLAPPPPRSGSRSDDDRPATTGGPVTVGRLWSRLMPLKPRGSAVAHNLTESFHHPSLKRPTSLLKATVGGLRRSASSPHVSSMASSSPSTTTVTPLDTVLTIRDGVDDDDDDDSADSAVSLPSDPSRADGAFLV